MAWLNYHHLLYFWTVAREGSIARACRVLHLAQPTISAQLKQLERSLGVELFARQGRRLVLTDAGRQAFRYADEMFTLGRELQDLLADRPTGRPLRLNVGVADAVPKLVAFRLLAPVLSLGEPVQLDCREGKPEALLAELALHGLDVVLSDAPVHAGAGFKAYSHLLGECPVLVCGAAPLARKFRRRFPRSLNGAPLLLPASNTALRRALDQWLDEQDLRPEVAGEFEDSALAKVFAQAGVGLVAVPAVIEADVRRQFGLCLVGRLEAVRERFYALSVERKLKHPAVLAITQAAREDLFPASPAARRGKA